MISLNLELNFFLNTSIFSTDFKIKNIFKKLSRNNLFLESSGKQKHLLKKMLCLPEFAKLV